MIDRGECVPGKSLSFHWTVSLKVSLFRGFLDSEFYRKNRRVLQKLF